MSTITLYEKKKIPLKRKFKILNPQGITMTPKGNHKASKYSKWKGSNYELSKMHDDGFVGLHGSIVPPRPFMELAKLKLENDPRARKLVAEKIKKSVNKKIILSKASRAEGGVWIDWSEVGEYIGHLIHTWVLEGKLGMAPLSKDTIEKKSSADCPDPEVPLYATGELAKSVSWVEN